jgi:DNA invertase Pin-like site-specific DNA recombinase
MTQALIYRRFSTDEQEFGSSDTLSRQLERCQDMAKAKGWTVTEVLTDKGRSAYKREHLLPDAELGKFMTRLRSGEFAKETILIADNLSRLSRRPVDEALAWIYEINAAGITIALADKSEVHRANPDMAEIIARTLSLGVAHKSSQEKSEMTLLSKARLWKSAETRTGKWVNLANRPPSWLARKPTLDGFDIIKERADVVRMIYQMSADGVGVVTIAGRLNSMDPPVPPFANAIKAKGQPHTWGRSSVRQILQSPNVEGDFRPISGVFKGQVIHDFYPRIIDADIVARARGDLAARRKVAGKSAASGSTNLFAGITTCGACGQARRGDAVDHRPVAQDRHVEPVAVKGHQRRSEAVHAGRECRDQIDFTPVADVGCTQRLNAPNAVDPFRDQRSENSDLMERKLRKLLAEKFDGLVVG